LASAGVDPSSGSAVVPHVDQYAAQIRRFLCRLSFIHHFSNNVTTINQLILRDFQVLVRTASALRLRLNRDS
jgi:hypothetical protein